MEKKLTHKDFRTLTDYDQLMEPFKWINKIPFLTFSSEWQVQVIPPFGGTIARFRVKKGDVFISVYLDVYDRLGAVGEPYWEIYPYEGDTFRCLMNETDSLIEAIKKALE